MGLRLQGVEELNAKLAELRELGRAPSFGTRKRAVEAGASLLKSRIRAATPSRSALYIAKGRDFGMTQKAKRLRDEYEGGRSFTMSINRGKVRMVRSGKKASTLKESIRYDATTGTSKHQVNIRIYARKPTAHLVEFGHRTRLGKRSGGKSKYYKPKPGGKAKVAARPFMEDAFNANAQDAIDAIAKQLNISLDRIIKREMKKRGV